MSGIASIEVGTHTARLLLARPTQDGSLIEPVLRERRTIRLAEGFGSRTTSPIGNEAFQRAAQAMRDFDRIVRHADARIVQAVSTGVTRTAVNRSEFIQRLADDSGVWVRPISGEEEAGLSARGVLHAMGPLGGPFVLFDLGGGTTEFCLGSKASGSETTVRSLPLGALVLKEAFFHEDPPGNESLRELAAWVDAVLARDLPEPRGFDSTPMLIGTGGSVTTLAAMAFGIDTSDIDPDRMNGMRLGRETLEALLARMIRIPAAERTALRGLDAGRVDVIPAGTLAVIRIVHHYGASELSVCLSDILEGLLITYLEGEGHE